MNDTRYTGVPTGLRKDKGLLPPYVEAGLFLLCGMIIGGGATVLLLNHTIRQAITKPELLPVRLLERMESRLALTEDQSTKAAGIIAEHFATFDGIRREIQPDIQRSIDSLRDEVADILDDRQRPIWESNFEDFRAKWKPGPLVPTNEELSDRIQNADNLNAQRAERE